MPSDPPRRADKSHDHDQKVEAVKPGFQRIVLVPLLAELSSDQGQTQTPWQRAQEGIHYELGQVHSSDSSRERNKGANDGQQPAREHNDLAVAAEPAVRQV